MLRQPDAVVERPALKAIKIGQSLACRAGEESETHVSTGNRSNYFVHTLLRARDWQHRPEFDQVCDWWRGRGLGFQPANQIDRKLEAYATRGQGVCALVGMGGAGKTACACRHHSKTTSIHTRRFLSHNSLDKPIVRQLADKLVALELRPWLDERELVPGRPWQEALEQIIQTTQTAAVMFGPAGLGPWEEPEMRACLNEFVKRKLPVIPVLLPGAPQQPELPLFLKAFTWVDLRGGLTNDGLDRLVWGITGQKPASISSPAGLKPHAPVTTQSESGPLATWKEKLEYLQEQEAITADPAQKFALKKQIEEAEQKIGELGG